VRLNFFLEEIDQPYVRDNFKRLKDAIDQEPLFKAGFKFFSIPLTTAVSAFKFPHNLGFKPRDVLLLSTSNNADVTFHYDSFTGTDIFFTTTASTTIRCFIGTYAEGTLA
jgi:hypothetical protein